VRIAVVGAGSWGTTLANLLAHQGHDVAIWAREPEVVESLNRDHVNGLFLADALVSEAVRASNELLEVVTPAELIVSAAPCHAVRQVSAHVAPALDGERPPIVVSVSKGLETDSLKTMSEVLGETLPGSPIVALSGPSFAREVYERQPTAVVVASRDGGAAKAVQQAFWTNYFRVYTSDDVRGVEFGGALKNVIAIAAGIVDGMGLGNNTRAALITRGLAEMTRMGQAMGASPMTFAGLAGMGDLILTATGALSRNRSLGLELAKGRSVEDILRGRRTVAEGVGTAKAALELGRQVGVELPITEQIEEILWEGKRPERAIRDLMEREPKPEWWQ
jgi:glycerol-3-phosphate dehydrogenase (NAD(P)+)